MTTLAYFGHRLQGQLAENPEGLSGVDVVWQGANPGELIALGKAQGISVLVAELEALGDNPSERLGRFRESCKPELTLVLHHFAKRDLLSSLLVGNTRTLQSPVALSSLRSQMLSLIVRDMLAPTSGPEHSSSKVTATSRDRGPKTTANTCPTCGAKLA